MFDSKSVVFEPKPKPKPKPEKYQPAADQGYHFLSTFFEIYFQIDNHQIISAFDTNVKGREHQAKAKARAREVPARCWPRISFSFQWTVLLSLISKEICLDRKESAASVAEWTFSEEWKALCWIQDSAAAEGLFIQNATIKFQLLSLTLSGEPGETVFWIS